jgi:hypothetical protein
MPILLPFPKVEDLLRERERQIGVILGRQLEIRKDGCI